MSLISVVVPVYNNASSLPDLLLRLQQVTDGLPGDQFEFVFVNDGSTDNSFEVLHDLRLADRRIQLVRLSRNFGSNSAIMAGLSRAHGEAIAVISADLQDPPELILEMLEIWRTGHKVVLAARRNRDDSTIEILLADTFYKLFRRFANRAMPERGFDFFLIDRQVSDHINHIQERNPYLMGLILWLGFNPQVVYYDRRQREKRYGRSMWTLGKKLKYFIDAFVAFSYAPIRLVTILGLIFSVIGLFYASIVILSRVAGQIEVEGWTSLMIVLLIVSGAQMVMLGLLGEYIWRGIDETRKRPAFIIDEVADSMFSVPEAEVTDDMRT